MAFQISLSHFLLCFCAFSLSGFLCVVVHKTQVSPCGIKSDLKHHISDSCVDPERFCEVEQQARPSMGVGLAKNGPKSEFQSFPDSNPDLSGSQSGFYS